MNNFKQFFEKYKITERIIYRDVRKILNDVFISSELKNDIFKIYPALNNKKKFIFFDFFKYKNSLINYFSNDYQNF